jgi:phage terminase large subunit
MQLNKNLQFLVDNVPTHRIVGLQGGTRSGKSYAVVQYLISLASKYNIGIISICRESYNALKATVLRDFIEILNSAGLYRDEDYNRTDHTYVLNGNVFEFFGMDSPGKVQGRKRNILFVNEVMETSQNVYRQLALRTENRIIMDFNPTSIEHWVYKELDREEATTLITTYLDNLENLNADTIAEIEYLKDADPDLWKVFGEGMPSSVRNQIYNHQKVSEYQPPSDFCYGLDFGYNHPTALVEVGHLDRSVQWHEIIYQSHLTPSDLIDLMIQKGVRKTIQIYADGARPEAIAEIHKAGFRIKAVEKYPGSVKEQIIKVKSRPLVISSESVNLLREIKSYKWSENNPDEPVKAFDDGMDAGRYGTHGLIKGKSRNPLISFTT